jgi:hypothetical protein
MDTAEQLRETNTRVKMRETQNEGPMTEKDWTGLKDENGNHGEVKATDDELKKIEQTKGREATPEDLKDLELHNTKVPKSDAPVTDEAMPRCQRCRGLTKGVKTTPELEQAERAMDRKNGDLFRPREPFGPSTPQEGGGGSGGNEGQGGAGGGGEGGSGRAGSRGEGGGEGASGVDNFDD